MTSRTFDEPPCEINGQFGIYDVAGPLCGPDRRSRNINILDAALDLAARGLPVFPARLCEEACLKCQICKTPACPHGFKDATTDLEEVCRLWRDHPGSLIGIATGATSGVDALDIDLPRHHTARDWWRQNRHRIPRTRIHRTGSGGLHALFRQNDIVRCVAGKIALGIDTRGTGGYVIWWPAFGLPVLSDAPLASWPDWLLEEFKPKPRAPGVTRTFCPEGLDWLRGLVRLVAATGEGERNSILFWASCRAGEAVRDGRGNEDFVVDVLIEAASRAGLPQEEARRTIQSGMRRS
jgi:Bifunctional DNA primase/polymerase, N-terminal